VDVDRDKIERVVREVLSDVEAGHQPDLDADSSGDLVAIGADHGGYRLKETLKQYLTEELGYRVLDVGTTSEASCDYPDFAVRVARAVASGEAWRGIMIDGAGIGSSMAANKVPGVLAACCHDVRTVVNSREHNAANVLTLGSGVVGRGLARQMVRVWLSTEFGGGRHERRVSKILTLEKE
jgi:ribose 5-phosphate isomerase B